MTTWASGQIFNECQDETTSESSDRIRDMTLGPQRRRLRIDDLGIRKAFGFAWRNKVPRGGWSPSRRPKNRRWRCREWRDGGNLAIRVPRNARDRLPA